MERQRQPEKREHQATASSSGKHHPSEHLGRSAKEQERPLRDDAARIRSREKSANDRRPKDSPAMPGMSKDDDYVRRWLAQTGSEINQNLTKSKMQQKGPDHRTKYQTEQRDIRSFSHTAHDIADTHMRSKLKRRHDSSSDSSLLEVAIKPKLHPLGRERSEHNITEEQEAPSIQPKKKRKFVSSDSGAFDESSVSSTPREGNFEKRARHKTREERYEPKEKKSRNSDRVGERKRSKTRREKRGDRKKRAKRAGEELMYNFSSNSIGQERLTIRPSHGPGLFKNGRASSPARRQGIPDLAFSEMEFLQYSNRHASTTREDSTTSKRHEKEMRKTSRAQDEISTFFKPSKTPLREIYAGERGQISENNNRPKYFMEVSDDKHGRERIPSARYPVKPFLGFGQPGPPSERYSDSHGFTLATHKNKTILDTTSMSPGQATTFVSWSETQFSPGSKALSKGRLTTYQGCKSPTPDSIRRSLENTGVFRDTGICTTAGVGSRRARVSPKADRGYQIQNLADILRSGERSETSRSSPSQSQAQIRSSRSSSTNRDPSSKVSHLNGNPSEQGRLENVHYERSAQDLHSLEGHGPSGENSQTVIKHFNSRSGWHQRPNSAQPGRQSPAVRLNTRGTLQESKRTPITREQIAKTARIKRPSTTLPVSTVAKGGYDLESKKPHLSDDKLERGTEIDKEAGNIEFPPQIPPEKYNQLVSPRYDDVSPAPPASIPGTEPKELVSCNQYAPDYDAKIETGQGVQRDKFDSPQVVVPSTTKPKIIQANLQNSVGLNPSDMEGLGRIENTSISATPLRESWIGRGFQQAFRLGRISPLLEAVPLYLHQMQHRYRSGQQKIQYEAATGNEADREFFDPTFSEMVPYMGNPQYSILEEVDSGDLGASVDSYPNFQLNEGYLVIEDDGGVYRAETDIWQPQLGLIEEEIDKHEWSREPQNTRSYEQGGEILYGHHALGPSYLDAEGDNVFDCNEGDGNMRVFWRPHRQY